MANLYYYHTPIGSIGIGEKNKQITHLLFQEINPPPNYQIRETPLLKEANKQLQEYFAGHRKSFNLDLNPSGTEFMQKVWSCLRKIPYGETRSYKDIAIAIDNKNAYRAVGLANSRNPIGIIIPCHRVINANGGLGGFGGGLDTKTFLLDLEERNK